MMMMMRLGLFLVGSLMTTALMTDSIAGRQLLAQSRQLEDSQDFLGEYVHTIHITYIYTVYMFE